MTWRARPLSPGHAHSESRSLGPDPCPSAVVRWAVETQHEGQQSRCMAFRVPPPRALCFASR